MNKQSVFAIILLLLLCAPLLALAQDEEPELVCESFTGSPADVRVSYYMGEGAAFFASSQLAAAVHSFSCVVEQIDTGYIPGSRSIPYRLLAVCGADLPRDRPVVTVCESGPRAVLAASLLLAQGVDARPVADGGVADWQRSGRPTVEFRRCGSTAAA